MNKNLRMLMTVALFGGMVLLACEYALQGSMLNSVIDFFSLSSSSQGMPNSAAFFGAFLGLVSSFFVIGRISKQSLLEIAIIVSAVFLLLLRFADSFPVFVGIWFVIGISLGYIDTLLSACLADLYTGKKGNTMMCMLHMSYGLINVLAPVLFALCMNSGLEWRNCYLIVAVFGIALMIFAAVIFGKYKKNVVLNQENRKISFGSMIDILKRGPLLWFMVATFFHGIFQSGMATWINRYVGVTLGSSLGDVAVSFLFIGIMLSRLLVPFMPFKGETYLRYAGFISTVTMVIALLLRNGLLVCIMVGITGLIFGGMLPLIFSFGCIVTPENSMFATTATMVSFYAGQAVVSPIIGAISERFGLWMGLVFCLVFMVITGFCNLFNKSLKKGIIE